MEERLDRDKRELKEHIDAAQIRLDKKVTNLELKTRNQLNEITRSMALERVKCQQRHLHLEQWLIRGSVFRNSEKVKQNGIPSASISKSKSLENILEEKPFFSDSLLRRSVDILNDNLDSQKDINDDWKNRSSSREGKESGKGSSEVGDLGTSDGEDAVDGVEQKRLQEGKFSEKLSERDKHEKKMRRTTREISERIDQILKSKDNVDGMGVIYDEMIKLKSYHNIFNERVPLPEREGDKENQRTSPDKALYRRPSPQDRATHLENRRSYHDLLKNKDSFSGENRERRLSDPRGSVEEPERTSVQEIVSKLQKQHTVQELVAKIQRKTGLIHKSAQKWKENKLKNKEKGKHLNEKKEDSESSEGEDETTSKVPHNYENIRQWDVPQEKLSQLPYRCRNTVYSPSPSLSPYENQEYQRHLYKPSSSQDFLNDYEPSSRRNHSDIQCDRKYSPSHGFDRHVYHSEQEMMREGFGSPVDITSELYPYDHSGGVLYHQDMRIGVDPRKMMRSGDSRHYSPTQNDSGYSTKPYGGSSTGPSPSLSGKYTSSQK